MYSSIIISINGLDIMVTLIGVYFEYIKFLCKIFTKYIVPILQVYPHLFIILFFNEFLNNISIMYLYWLHGIKN